MTFLPSFDYIKLNRLQKVNIYLVSNIHKFYQVWVDFESLAFQLEIMGEFLHLIAKVQHWWCDIRRFFNKVTKPYALFFSSTEKQFPLASSSKRQLSLCSLVAFLEFSKTRNPPIIEFFSPLPNQKFICLTRSRLARRRRRNRWWIETWNGDMSVTKV